MSELEQKLRAISQSIAAVSQSIRALGQARQQHQLKKRNLEVALADAPEDGKEAAEGELKAYMDQYNTDSQTTLTMELQESDLPTESSITVSCSQPINDYPLPPSTPVLIQGVKKGLATLTFTSKNADGEIIGESDALDVEPLCKDGAKAVEVVTLKSPLASSESDVEEVKEYSVKVEFAYVRGHEDGMEELRVEYEGLTKERMEVIGELRKEAAIKAKAQAQGGAGGGQAVKKGFLNAGSGNKKSGFIVGLYDRLVGPESWVRTTGMKYKNFVLFFGVVGIVSFKGEELALPEPV